MPLSKWSLRFNVSVYPSTCLALIAQAKRGGTEGGSRPLAKMATDAQPSQNQKYPQNTLRFTQGFFRGSFRTVLVDSIASFIV